MHQIAPAITKPAAEATWSIFVKDRSDSPVVSMVETDKHPPPSSNRTSGSTNIPKGTFG